MRGSNWLVVPALASLLAAAPPARAIGRAEIVARAQEWVDAKLLYCVPTRGAYDATCKYTCNRQDNPAWNGYFSDCSGLITWAWGLSEAQRLYTGSIEPGLFHLHPRPLYTDLQPASITQPSPTPQRTQRQATPAYPR